MKTYFSSFIIILTVVSLYTYSIAPPTAKFFVTKHQPEYVSLNLAVTRIVVWYPWPFASVSFGWLVGDSPKFTALQMYLGIKCDGSRTVMTGGPPPYVMVLTPREMAAIRIHSIDRIPVWNNQGGA